MCNVHLSIVYYMNMFANTSLYENSRLVVSIIFSTQK